MLTLAGDVGVVEAVEKLVEVSGVDVDDEEAVADAAAGAFSESLE